MVWRPAPSRRCRLPTVLRLRVSVEVPTFSPMRLPEGFESLERRNADRSVVTEQRVRAVRPVVPFTPDGARALGRCYWREVARASRGLVRYRETTDRVELTLLGRGPALLRFRGAEVAVGADRVSCSYHIRGGLLSVAEGRDARRVAERTRGAGTPRCGRRLLRASRRWPCL